MQWQTRLDAYAGYLSGVMSANSAQTYRAWAKDFSMLADRAGWPVESPKLLRAYAKAKLTQATQRAETRGQDVTDSQRRMRSTLRSALPAVRRYFRWLAEQDVAVPGQFEPELPRIGRRIQYTPGTDDYARFLEAAGAYEPPYGTALQLLAFTGMRDSELLRLTLDDGDFKRDGRVVFTVRGKGDKLREVPLLRVGEPVLRQYLTDVRPTLVLSPTCRWLFPTPGPSRSLQGPVARKSMERHMRLLRAKIGLSRLTCHALRRYYITSQRQAGMAEADIASIVGHADLKLFMTYYRPTGDQLADRLSATGG